MMTPEEADKFIGNPGRIGVWKTQAGSGNTVLSHYRYRKWNGKEWLLSYSEKAMGADAALSAALKQMREPGSITSLRLSLISGTAPIFICDENGNKPDLFGEQLGLFE